MSTAYLFLHGFGGGTHELLYLENILKAHGAEVYNQNIIGHGKDKKELSLTNHIDWLRYAEDIFDNLRKKHDNIIVIGFSMGGILGLNLAATRKIEKLVLINTPMFVWNIPVIIKDVLIPQKGWALKMRLYKKYAFNSSIKSCLDFTKLLKIARKLPEKVH
jgi:carboxylesterase